MKPQDPPEISLHGRRVLVTGAARGLGEAFVRALVAATQFTAYTALMNLTITISARWQGLSIEALGYANTLLLDVLAGSLILLFLPLIRPDPAPCASARTASGGEDQADGARSRPP